MKRDVFSSYDGVFSLYRRAIYGMLLLALSAIAMAGFFAWKMVKPIESVFVATEEGTFMAKAQEDSLLEYECVAFTNYLLQLIFSSHLEHNLETLYHQMEDSALLSLKELLHSSITMNIANGFSPRVEMGKYRWFKHEKEFLCSYRLHLSPPKGEETVKESESEGGLSLSLRKVKRTKNNPSGLLVTKMTFLTKKELTKQLSRRHES